MLNVSTYDFFLSSNIKVIKRNWKKTNVIFVVILPIVVESKILTQLFVHLVFFQKTNFLKLIWEPEMPITNGMI